MGGTGAVTAFVMIHLCRQSVGGGGGGSGGLRASNKQQQPPPQQRITLGEFRVLCVELGIVRNAETNARFARPVTRRLFQLVDDCSHCVAKDDLIHAMESDSEVRKTLTQCPRLQMLLKPTTFTKALHSMDTEVGE